VRVSYSSLNYKDAMAIRGRGKLVQRYPHVPGIDLVGEVETSAHRRIGPGEKVIATGCGLGEQHWGGYAGKARLSGDWCVPLGDCLGEREAMALGTAGFTAMLALMALEARGLKPGDGEVLVTGATGGVGSIAVALLAGAGHRVVASTGKREAHDYLRRLGAAQVMDRAELETPSGRPLEKARWAGCVDNVGGVTLGRVLGQLRGRASVAAVGLAGGNEMTGTVLPFLLRGVNLLGIASASEQMDRRQRAWERLGAEMDRNKLEQVIACEAGLEELPGLADAILAGKVRGRVVVDVNR